MAVQDSTTIEPSMVVAIYGLNYDKCVTIYWWYMVSSASMDTPRCFSLIGVNDTIGVPYIVTAVNFDLKIITSHKSASERKSNSYQQSKQPL